MKFQINNKSEFYVIFPEDVKNIIGLDAECFWGNSEKKEYILVSSVFDVLNSLKHAIKEVFSGASEIKEQSYIGNIGKNYNESNETFLAQIEYGDASLPQESKYGIWLGNGILTFIYSYKEIIYIEVSRGYPYSYTEEKIIDFPTWMVNFESLSLTSMEKRDLENWLIKIDFYLDQIL